MKNIVTIIKKDFKRFFTDKRMVLNLLLPGVMIFVIYSLMGTFMFKENDKEDNYQYRVVVVNDMFVNDEYLIRKNFESLELNIDWIELSSIEGNPIDLVENEMLDLYVVFDEDFYNKAIDFNPDIHGSGNSPKVLVYHNSTNDNSSNINHLYLFALSSFQESISEKFQINPPGINYDLASMDSLILDLVSGMVPFLLIIFLFTGVMSISVEAIAGEKERGTIATILATPIKRYELALGKIISLSLVSLVSASSSFIGLVLSFPKLLGPLDIDFFALYNFGHFLLLFFLILTTTLLYTVIISLASAFSKSVKEATGIASVLMIINMVIGITSMAGTSSKFYLYLIPFYNSVGSMASVLGNNINLTNLLITIFINIGFVGIGTYLLALMFNNEKIMFNK